MELTLDLRLEPDPAGGPEWRDLSTLLGELRRPRHLAHLLWGRRWDTVVVVEDGLSRSAVQGLAMVAAGLARAARFELVAPDGRRSSGRVSFLGRALAGLTRAVPAELARTLAAAARVRRVARGHVRPPQARADGTGVLYLRAEPTMRWRGEYVGGAATHTTGVINGFVESGLDVDVVAPERPLGTEGVEFTPVAPRHSFHLVEWLATADYSELVAGSVAPSRPRFVYQRYALGSYAGHALACRLGAPLVLEFNGSEIWTQRHWRGGRLPLEGTAAALEGRMLRDAALVVAVSQPLAEQVEEQGVDPRRVLVNPNGVDVDRLAGLRAGSLADRRSAAGLPEAPTVGFVGTFSAWHGVLLLPELIDKLAASVPEARWVLVGDGPLHSRVAEAVAASPHANRVLLSGLVPRERALELVAACEVCVSPHVPNPDGSRFFGSPTKLFEYMGLGKAIVASRLEQIGEVLEHERTGLLFPPGEVDAAARAVERLLRDEDLRRRLGDAALREASTTYSWGAHARRIVDALEDAADASVTRRGVPHQLP